MRECPDCEKPLHGTSCHRCGWTLSPPAGAKPLDTHRPWTPPVYPDPPATVEERRIALDQIFALLGGRPVRAAPPRDLPPVDPAIRADLERRGETEPERVGETGRRARWWRPKGAA